MITADTLRELNSLVARYSRLEMERRKPLDTTTRKEVEREHMEVEHALLDMGFDISTV